MGILPKFKNSIPWLFFLGTEIFLLLLLLPSNSFALELSLPDVHGAGGQSVSVPVLVDKIDNLAGLKLIIEYDPAVLTFSKVLKSEQTSQLMHIVNDKNPGRLIIVMAGAVGIQGENLELMRLIFLIGDALDKKDGSTITIAESELMSDSLQQLTHTTKPGHVLPPAADKENTDSTPTDSSLKTPQN